MKKKDKDILRRDGEEEGPVGHQTVAVDVCWMRVRSRKRKRSPSVIDALMRLAPSPHAERHRCTQGPSEHPLSTGNIQKAQVITKSFEA